MALMVWILGSVLQFILWLASLQRPFSGIWTGSSLPLFLPQLGPLDLWPQTLRTEIVLSLCFPSHLQNGKDTLKYVVGYVFGGEVDIVARQ